MALVALSEAEQVESEAWVAQYAAGAAALESGSAAATWASFTEITDWYDVDQTIAATRSAVSAAASVRQASAGLASEFIANIIAILTGRPHGSTGSVDIEQVRDADPFQVWSRPMWTYKETIARGGTESEAFIAARNRAEVIATTEAILAERDAAIAEVIRQSREVQVDLKYRRVIRPELSKTGTCGLCIAASTQVYSLDILMPIHERCKCVVMPIVGADDPGRRMNATDLKQVYADAGSAGRADLKRTRYRVDEHGELGPVLTDALKARRSRATSPGLDPERARTELAALLPVLSSLEAREAAGEDVSGPLGYQRSRIAQLRQVAA